MTANQCGQMPTRGGVIPAKNKRDKTIDVLKGIGIILMVVGHSRCPQPLYDFIYTFHMPLFFIASGYFFNCKSITTKQQFFIKKIKGIYKPFVICSLAFLLLHNLFFHIGIINDVYGNDTFVSHPYSIKKIIQIALNIIFRMDQYEPFLLGAYWFMRALFISSLFLCYGTWFMNKKIKSVDKSILVLSVLCLLAGGLLKYKHIYIPYVAQGGYREMVGVFFLGAGYMLRKYISILQNNNIAFFISVIVLTTLYYIHPASLELKSTFIDWTIIPFSGISGTYIVYCISKKVSEKCNILAYLGQKSIWILSLHLLAFKISGLIEIHIYNLPKEIIGCHPVVTPTNDWFFMVHALFGITIPIMFAYIYSTINKKRAFC